MSETGPDWFPLGYQLFVGTATIMWKNNEKNDKFYRKVPSLMYTEMVNFMPQSWKAASKLEPHRGLATRMPSDNGHVTH